MTAALTLAAEHDLGPLLPKDNEKWLVSQFIRNRVVPGARAEVQAS